MTAMRSHPVLLLDRDVRDASRTIGAMVRRRVPPSEVEDITQTVLCDALTAPKLPREPTELRRFLCVMARNKVADFHRRARRMVSGGDDDACADAIAPAPAVEERALLERVVSSSSPRERETLGWLVREHEGEQLAEIAEDVGLPATTVRKRVSRLRRVLRERYGALLAAIVLAGVGGGAALRGARDDARGGAVAITRDPSEDRGAEALRLAQGRWVLAPGATIDHATVGALDASAIEVRVHGARIEIFAPIAVASRTIVKASAMGADAYVLVLRDDGNGKEQRAFVTVRGDRLEVTLGEGAVRGHAVMAPAR